MSRERTYKVDLLTRVEGEGRFHLVVDGEDVKEAHLSIFEAPRFFEAFMRGRSFQEAPDIVARICGICPVAYQMSAVRALENALAWVPTPEIRTLRRLLYCGEWIESHALHVFLLHAPDFLGYASAMDMARDHKALVERGLRMKKAGNSLIEVLGGRAIHPVSVRVGGFSRAPSPAELGALRPALEQGLGDALTTVKWASGLRAPELESDYVFVTLCAQDYPLEWGDQIAISGRGQFPVEAFDELFEEQQVARSNALHCRLRDGTPYLCGPMARLNHAHERLHPTALAALATSGLTLPLRNPYRSIVVRAIELVHAFAEALAIIDGYSCPQPACFDLEAASASGSGASEAPRGLLWHRYELDAGGLVETARIVPPTSQNQARIEADLVAIAPELLRLDHDAATRRCEQLIRAYDPCISCATHFLELTIDRAGADRSSAI
ncbi:MAG: nickel-dependent hydrogenase large subunit [Proteobacteria bacterium]|nr:nickel-dependent hydrogenase large subunit [Pseudomonadota bacterium]